MILYSVASPPLTLPTYAFSHYVMCIVGCIVGRHRKTTLSTWLPMPDIDDKYWEKNLCLSWDLNLRSPVLRTGDLTNERFVSELVYVSRWTNWFSRRCVKPEIWGSNPSLDRNFSLNICHLQYNHPPYLSPFTKCFEDVTHHQRIHLCWCSVLTAL